MTTQTLAPVTVTAPDTTEIERAYQTTLSPIQNFTVTSDDDYVLAKQYFTQAKGFISSVEDRFREAKSAANKAHKAITTLEGSLIQPGKQIAARMQSEILRWEDVKKAEARAEQARLQREQEEQARIAREAALKSAEEARLAALDDLAPWEIEDAKAVIEQTEAAIPEPPPMVPVHVVPNIPVVFGGPTTRAKPWAAEVFDFPALVKAAAANPALLEFLEPKMPTLNTKARELGADLENVVPGVRGVQGRTLVG
jgi:hypothetical protein